MLPRLQLEARGGGLGGIGSYDDGMHFAAAVSMVHGLVRYRDSLFLQPPGILLGAAPFALAATVIPRTRQQSSGAITPTWCSGCTPGLIR